MDLPVIYLRYLTIQSRKHLGLFFKYDRTLIEHTKKIRGIRWNPGHKCWHIGRDSIHPEEIIAHYRGVAIIQDQLDLSGVIRKEKPQPLFIKNGNFEQKN